MRILEEIDKRLEKGDNTDALIGAELKLRRNSLSKTLESVCGDTCSISYLSKVENNEIRPNPKLLEELCKKVNLKKENIDLIKRGREVYKETIDAYFIQDSVKLNEIYEECFEMKNYRSKIMKLFHLVYVGNMRVAKRIIGELEKIMSSILYSDLVIYTFILAEYFYKDNEKLKAFKLYKKLISLDLEYKKIYILSLEGIMRILKEINSPLYLGYFDELKNAYIDELYYDRIPKLEENILWYYLQNGFYNLVLDKINNSNQEYRSIKLIVCAKLGIKLDEDIKPTGFSEMVYLYHFNLMKFYEGFNNDNLNLSDSEYLIIKLMYNYLSKKDLYSYLSCEFFPYAFSTKDQKLITVSFNLIMEELKNRSKYKKCLDYLDMLLNYRKECEEYC